MFIIDFNYPSVFTLSVLCIVLALSSCNSPSRSGSKTYSYTINHKKQLKVDTSSISMGKDSSRTLLNISTEDGNNTVFKYNYNKMSPPGVADGGFSETIYFEIPRNKKEVKLQDFSLENANVYYLRSCFCRRIGALKITDGTIKGEQLSPGKWYVNASLNVHFPYNQSGSRKVTFRHLFRQR